MQTTILVALLASLPYSLGQLIPISNEAVDESQPKGLFDSNIPAADAWKFRSKVYANGGNTQEKPNIKAMNDAGASSNNKADSNGAPVQPQNKQPEIIIINSGNNAPQPAAQQGGGALTVVVSGAAATTTSAPQQGGRAGSGPGAFGGLGGTLTAAGTPIIGQNGGQVPAAATPVPGGGNTTNMGGTIIAQGSGTSSNGVCTCSCNCPSSGFNAAGQIGEIPQNPALTRNNGTTGSAAFAGLGGTLSQAGLSSMTSAASEMMAPQMPGMKGMPPGGAGQEGSLITTSSMATGVGSMPVTAGASATGPSPTSATFPLGGGATASTAVTAVMTQSSASLNSELSLNLPLKDAKPASSTGGGMAMR